MPGSSPSGRFAAAQAAVGVLLALSAQLGPAAGSQVAEDSVNVIVPADSLDWQGSGDMRFATLYGNSSEPGQFAFRIETRPGFEMAPHTHPATEHLTVLSGTLHLGFGETFDKGKGTAYGPGSYVAVGAGVAAYMWFEELTVVQVHGTGPFTTQYVGREGDPAAGGGAPSDPEVEELESGTDAVLQAVSPVSAEVVWTSGHAGAVLVTLDGGKSWERRGGPSGDSLQFRDIHAFSARGAVAMSAGSGSASRIYRTSDGGESWALAFLMDHPEGFLDCLDFWDDERGFAYGDSFDGSPYVLSTDDGGGSWRRVPRDALPPANEGEGGFAASGTCARAGEDGRGWIGTGAGGSARVLATDDYGSTWTAAEVDLARGPSAGVYTLAVLSDGKEARVMALGGDYAAEDVLANAAISDGGGNWRPVANAPIAGAVYGSTAALVDGREIVLAVSPAGAAYTEDRGESWTALAGVAAWAVEFAPGDRVGWAVGAEGRIWRLRFQ